MLQSSSSSSSSHHHHLHHHHHHHYPNPLQPEPYATSRSSFLLEKNVQKEEEFRNTIEKYNILVVVRIYIDSILIV